MMEVMRVWKHDIIVSSTDNKFVECKQDRWNSAVKLVISGTNKETEQTQKIVEIWSDFNRKLNEWSGKSNIKFKNPKTFKRNLKAHFDSIKI